MSDSEIGLKVLVQYYEKTTYCCQEQTWGKNNFQHFYLFEVLRDQKMLTISEKELLIGYVVLLETVLSMNEPTGVIYVKPASNFPQQ